MLPRLGGTMNLDFETRDDVLLVRVQDARVDASVTGDFRHQVDSHLVAGCNKILVDLQAVEFLDSSGLSALIALYKGLPSGQIAICNARPKVEAVFKLTRLDRLLLICPTIDDGIEALRRTSGA
jgi:anti-sigma B factor antagonist